MSTKHFCFLIFIVFTLLVGSLFSFPMLTHASKIQKQKMTPMKMQMIRHLAKYAGKQERILHQKQVRTKSSSEVTDVTEARYSGSITNNYNFHAYAFSVQQGGTVQISGTSLTGLDYAIYKIDDLRRLPPDHLPPMKDGSEITPGDYVLFIMGLSDSSVFYDFTLSGFTFTGSPSNKLPHLFVSWPMENKTKIYNTTNIRFTGLCTDEVDLWLNEAEQPIDIPTYEDYPFDKQVQGQLGLNALEIDAINVDGNLQGIIYHVEATGLERVSGSTRYDVSANIGKKLPVASDTVVIARGDLFPDALSGGPLATVEKAPILLTKTDNLEAPIQAEIKRRQPKHVLILGGTGAIAPIVETQIKETLGESVTIERIDGADRFVVSAEIAEQVKKKGISSDTAFIVSGLDFPDALAASSPAGKMNAPVLLTRKNFMPAPIEAFVKSHSEIKRYVIVGGTGVVDSAVGKKLASLGKTVVRYGGENRYHTAIKVAQAFGQQHSLNQIIARGDLFPDALSGGPLASYLDAPILLTPPTSVNTYTANYLSLYTPEVIRILGSEGAVSDDVAKKLSGYLVKAPKVWTAGSIDSFFEPVQTKPFYIGTSGTKVLEIEGSIPSTADVKEYTVDVIRDGKLIYSNTLLANLRSGYKINIPAAGNYSLRVTGQDPSNPLTVEYLIHD